MLKFVQ